MLILQDSTTNKTATNKKYLEKGFVHVLITYTNKVVSPTECNTVRLA